MLLADVFRRRVELELHVAAAADTWRKLRARDARDLVVAVLAVEIMIYVVDPRSGHRLSGLEKLVPIHSSNDRRAPHQRPGQPPPGVAASSEAGNKAETGHFVLGRAAHPEASLLWLGGQMAWNTESEPFHLGLRLDPDGCGAGWARIAIAARDTSPEDALECARRALQTNPEAWRAWYDAFIESRQEAAA